MTFILCVIVGRGETRGREECFESETFCIVVLATRMSMVLPFIKSSSVVFVVYPAICAMEMGRHGRRWRRGRKRKRRTKVAKM